MEGIFSKNLNKLKKSHNKSAEKNMSKFIKDQNESSFTSEFFNTYHQINNPQSNFFSKNLMDEINYMNIKGENFFGAFSNNEKKMEYFQKIGNENNIKRFNIPFGIPRLKEKVIINKNTKNSVENKIENDFNKYLILYPEDNDIHLINQERNKNLKKLIPCQINKKLKFDNENLNEDYLILSLNDSIDKDNLKDDKILNENITRNSIKSIDNTICSDYENSRMLFINQKNLLGKFLSSEKSTISKSYLAYEKMNLTNSCFYPINEKICLLNPHTLINYEKKLVESYHNMIYDLPTPIEINELYSCIIFLMQGIPSKIFSFDYVNFYFVINNKSFRIIGTTNDLLCSYLNDFLQFGTSIFLIKSITDFYLFKNENTPVLAKKFYEFLSTFLIKINEKFISLKTRLTIKKDLYLTGLLVKLRKYSYLISLIYHILNLNDIIKKFKQIQLKNNLLNTKNISENIYQECDFPKIKNINIFKNFIELDEFLIFFSHSSTLKSTFLIDSLFDYFYYFHMKDNKYYLVKNLLTNTLKSYMKFIYFIIFNNQIIDVTEDFFRKKSFNKKDVYSDYQISINTEKIPKFLYEYKTIILNTSILINLLSKFNRNYFTLCHMKLLELVKYVENFDLDNSFTNETISEFIAIKDNFFNLKLDLFTNQDQFEKNQFESKKAEKKIIRMKNIENIKINLAKRQEDLDKVFSDNNKQKAKYLVELQNQINEKNKILQEKNLKIKNEQLLKKAKDKEVEEIKDLIKSKLMIRYQKILVETKKFEIFSTEKNYWRFNREKNNEIRNKIFSEIYDDRISYKNIFTNDPSRISGFTLNDYLRNYQLDPKELLKKIQLNINFRLNENSNRYVFNYPYNIQEDQKNNYHITNYEMNLSKKLDEKEKKNELIEEILNQKEKSNIAHSNSVLNNFNNSSLMDIEEKVEIQINQSKEIISIQNPKLIDELSDQNKKRTYEMVKSHILFPLINKTVIEYEKKIEKSEVKKSRSRKTQGEKKDNIIPSMELSISDELFEMIYTIQSVIDKKSAENKLKSKKNLSKESKNKNLPENFIEIPMQIILQEFFYDLIMRQYNIVNICFISMMKYNYEIKSHYKICSDVFLHGTGDIIKSLMEKMFDYRTLTLESIDPNFLNEVIKNELSKKLKNNSERFVDDHSIIRSFVFSYYKNFELKFSLTNIEYAFNISYNIPPPINFCFSKEINSLYSDIFKRLLKWKIYQSLNSKIFEVIKDFDGKKLKDGLLMKVWIVLNRAFNIVNSINSYIFSEIISKRVINFERELNEFTDIFEINKKHFILVEEISRILFTYIYQERYNHTNLQTQTNLSIIGNKEKEFVVINPIIKLFEKLNSNIGKFYQKSCAYDIFDFETLKNDEKFLKIVRKIEKYNNEITNKIIEEEIIGEFYNLKFYIE